MSARPEGSPPEVTLETSMGPFTVEVSLSHFFAYRINDNTFRPWHSYIELTRTWDLDFILYNSTSNCIFLESSLNFRILERGFRVYNVLICVSIFTQMYYKHSPRTCRNFLELSRRGYYDNVLFHRIVKVCFLCVSVYFSLYLRSSLWWSFKEIVLLCYWSVSGFHCARWGSYRNWKRWWIHLWVRYHRFSLINASFACWFFVSNQIWIWGHKQALM